ncbi:MAG TPA: DUF4465 domain-containing protein [Bacteroidales bacterium]|nr:DUF4465 domain-containing protein [Bacteroidales bacterium]
MKNFVSYTSAVFLFFVALLIVGCTDEDNFKTDVATFGNLELVESSYWNGSDFSGSFSSGNKIFHNQYYPDWNTWSGFAYSKMINYEFFNEESVYAVYHENTNNNENFYAVAHQLGQITITFKDSIHREQLRSVKLANTTYTALGILYGYDYAKKFGGKDGSDPDWFKVTIKGIGMDEQITGTVDFFLADYRFADNKDDYIVNKWEYVDLTPLGIVKRLEFEMFSSDAGTPLYFCLDNLKGRILFDE